MVPERDEMREGAGRRGGTEKQGDKWRVGRKGEIRRKRSLPSPIFYTPLAPLAKWRNGEKKKESSFHSIEGCE